MLRAENIHKIYYLGRTTLPVLRGVGLTVRRDEFVSITGSSGSGKSTLLHVMSGLDVPQRGQVFFEDQELFEPEGQRRIPVGRESDRSRSTAPPAASGGERTVVTRTTGVDARGLEGTRNRLRNRAFGFVFQFYHLLPEFDVLENILLPRMVGQSAGGWLSGRGETDDRARMLLKRVGLEDRIRHRPNELSGGERQRVAIARALINEPAVLLADEPTGNLDGKTGRAIFNLLKELNEAGQTIVMVTHDRELARESDRCVHLVDGRIE